VRAAKAGSTAPMAPFSGPREKAETAWRTLPHMGYRRLCLKLLYGANHVPDLADLQPRRRLKIRCIAAQVT
jgi:hypothetical protein